MEVMHLRLLHIMTLLVGVLLLTGCDTLTRLQGIDPVQLQRVESGIAEVRQNLYVPADAVQLAEAQQTGLRGTGRGCLGGYLEIRYGINRPFEQVLKEYRQALLENGWEVSDIYNSSEKRAFFQQRPEVVLLIDAEPTWLRVPTPGPDEEKRFQVIYGVLLMFDDPSHSGCNG
jgi:hypothetical protein